MTGSAIVDAQKCLVSKNNKVSPGPFGYKGLEFLRSKEKALSGHPVPAEGTFMQPKCSAYILSALVNPLGTEGEMHGFSEQ